MDCDRWQEAISATIDGEPAGIDDRLLVAHLERCPECRAFREAATVARRRLLVTAAEPQRDLSRRIVKLHQLAERAAQWRIARVVLGVVALEIVAFAAPALVLGDEAHAAAHEARHIGAFTVAYGVALLVVVVRPARARTMLPVAAVLAGTLMITAVVDLTSGHVPLLGEAQHLPELLSVLLVWLLAAPAPWRPAGQTGAFDGAHGRPVLRLLDDEHRQTG